MEILELVHQETAPSLERPFECTFKECKKTFGNNNKNKACTFDSTFYFCR